MSFKRRNDYRGMELTSLIDVVFLLLVFFLVSFAFSLAGDVSESQTYAELELPKTNTQLPAIEDDFLDNLMIQIMPDTVEGVATKKVYVLWPSFEVGGRITRYQAMQHARGDSTFAAFPAHTLGLSEEDFQSLGPNRLITESIREFVKKQKFYRPNSRPVIEVRADESTEFRIISFIMNRCSEYQDDIPQIIVRTTL